MEKEIIILKEFFLSQLEHIDVNRIQQWGEDRIRTNAPFSKADLRSLAENGANCDVRK